MVFSNPVHPHGSLSSLTLFPLLSPLPLTFGLGGFGGACKSNEEFVLAGLRALSKLSPLTLCAEDAFKLFEVLLWRLGLRAGGPRIWTILSGSPRKEGDGGRFFGFAPPVVPPFVLDRGDIPEEEDPDGGPGGIRDFRSYFARIKRSRSVSSEEEVGVGLLLGLYF